MCPPPCDGSCHSIQGANNEQKLFLTCEWCVCLSERVRPCVCVMVTADTVCNTEMIGGDYELHKHWQSLGLLYQMSYVTFWYSTYSDKFEAETRWHQTKVFQQPCFWFHFFGFCLKPYWICVSGGIERLRGLWSCSSLLNVLFKSTAWTPDRRRRPRCWPFQRAHKGITRVTATERNASIITGKYYRKIIFILSIVFWETSGSLKFHVASVLIIKT